MQIAQSTPQRLVIDFHKVRMISSSVIAGLLVVKSPAARGGKRLSLTMTDSLRAVFGTMDLDDFPSVLDLAGRSIYRSIDRLRSVSKVEAIEIHHLVPGRHEVIDKLLLRVVTGIDFRDGSKLRVRTKHEIDSSASPFDLTRLAVPSFEDVLAFWRTSATPCSCPAGSRRSHWSTSQVAW